MNIDVNSILQETIEAIAKRAVEQVIAKESGYGLDTEIKAVIRKEAERLIKEDQQIKQMIRESVIRWVNKQ